MNRSSAMLSSFLAASLFVVGCDRDGAEVVDRVEDAASVPVGQTSARVLGGNMASAYIASALMGDLYEIEAANIALERSQSATVRALAQNVRIQRAASRATLKALAAAEAPSAIEPDGLDHRRQGLMDNLRKAAASDFDRIYLDQLVAAQEEAITLNRSFADQADTPGLVKNALTVLPQIEDLRDQARRVRGTLPP